MTLPHGGARGRVGSEEADGRRRRSAKSHEAIISALIDLVGEGDMSPSAQRVADRAGVGIRTVFRHFEEMDRLYAEMNKRLRAMAVPMFEVPESSDALSERLRALVGRRCELFEKIAPYKRSANRAIYGSPFLRKERFAMIRDLRLDLERTVPELLRAPEPIAHALEMVLSFEAWDQLRTDQRLSQREAREAMGGLVEALGAHIPMAPARRKGR